MRTAVSFAIIAALLAAADTVLVKILAQRLHAIEIAFIRSASGFLIVLPWLLSRQISLRSSMLPRHFVRAVIKYMAIVAFFVAVAHAPVADVTAISLLTPLLSLTGAWIFLKEGRSWIHVAAIVLGIAGALIIIQPGAPAFNPYLLLAIGGAIGLSSVMLLLKKLTDADLPETILFWNLLFTAIVSAAPALMFWTTPTPLESLLLLFQGGLSATGILMMAHAARAGAVSQIAGLDFLRLPVAAILAFLVLGEPVNQAVWIAGPMIVVAALILRSAARPE